MSRWDKILIGTIITLMLAIGSYGFILVDFLAPEKTYSKTEFSQNDIQEISKAVQIDFPKGVIFEYLEYEPAFRDSSLKLKFRIPEEINAELITRVEQNYLQSKNFVQGSSDAPENATAEYLPKNNRAFTSLFVLKSTAEFDYFYLSYNNPPSSVSVIFQ